MPTIGNGWTAALLTVHHVKNDRINSELVKTKNKKRNIFVFCPFINLSEGFFFFYQVRVGFPFMSTTGSNIVLELDRKRPGDPGMGVTNLTHTWGHVVHRNHTVSCATLFRVDCDRLLFIVPRNLPSVHLDTNIPRALENRFTAVGTGRSLYTHYMCAVRRSGGIHTGPGNFYPEIASRQP